MRLAPTSLQLLLSIFLIANADTYAIPKFLKRFLGMKEAGHPVVLVPGDGGSQLEANLTGKPTVPHYICSKITGDYFDLWLNLELFAPLVIDCWVDNMQLVYDNETGLSDNMEGVDIKIPGFGDTNSVEWLDKSHASQGMYFATIADHLVASGYRRGKNIIGAPYDWRKSPKELHDFYLNLKASIETAYYWNNNKKVVIVGHSMGNPVMLYFYQNYVDQDWKDKFIKSHVSLAAPWGGSMQIVRLFVSGYNMNYYRIVLPPSRLRAMQRSFTSSAFLFPSPEVWGPDEVFASTDKANYTTSNIEQLFKDSNYELGWEQYQQHGNLLGKLEAPGVPIHCVYGTNVSTPETFHWSSYWFPDYPPTEYEGDGDGTVNKRSSLVCERWIGNNNGKEVTLHEVPKADHMAILADPQALDIITKVVYDEM